MSPSGTSSYLSFALSDEFVDSYIGRRPEWGFPIGGGNNLSELIFIAQYSRLKDDGTKERWYETCRRCIEGMYSILKDHCAHNRTTWNEPKAQRSAQEAFERMFTFKWTPPGRGLWMMGSEFVHAQNDSAALQNCSFLSTEKMAPNNVAETIRPFTRLMEQSMLGIGVGFDTRGAGKIKFHQPNPNETKVFVVPDSREGWVESLGLLLESYWFANRPTIVFDYSQVRPAGVPLKRFGGVASGPGPLKLMHETLRQLFDNREGEVVGVREIVDVNNLSGKCVVAGSIRRSAELALGEYDDKEFVNLKNPRMFPDRNGVVLDPFTDDIAVDDNGVWKRTENGGWSHLSNNTVFARVGDDLNYIADRIVNNGEPGLYYLDVARQFGRLVDPPNNKDHRVKGCNPCAEQPLEPDELCTLVDVYLPRHESLEDFTRTLKFAYLYGKAVTLMPTRWPESNEVMQRNRRIGLSLSGVAEFADRNSMNDLRTWLEAGYAAVSSRDVQYSEWLAVRESIKMTSEKPGGTTGLLAGTTAGAHRMAARGDVWRRWRLSNQNPMIGILQEAGYHVEPEVTDPTHGSVVTFPLRGLDIPSEKEVSLWEKVQLAVFMQKYWADNMVSYTASFKPEERDELVRVLQMYEGQYKSMSFLPLDTNAYPQMPWEEADDMTEFERMYESVSKVDVDRLYAGEALDAEGEKFCSTDRCEIPQRQG